jgi:hypothetical protein
MTLNVFIEQIWEATTILSWTFSKFVCQTDYKYRIGYFIQILYLSKVLLHNSSCIIIHSMKYSISLIDDIERSIVWLLIVMIYKL